MNNPVTCQSAPGLATNDQAVTSTSKQSLMHAGLLGVIGLVAAMIAFLAIRQTGRVFEMPAELMDLKLAEGRNQSPEVMKKFQDGLSLLNYKHAALWIGMAGSIVGVLFGMTLGIIRRSRVSMISGALGGLLLGGAFAICAGLTANFLGENVISPERQLRIEVPPHYTMLLHGTTWMIVGLGVGLGTGLGVTKNRLSNLINSMLMSGLAGAAAGAFYPFVASVAMPFVDPTFTVPEGDVNRLVWLGMPMVFMGLTLGRRS